MMNINNLFFAEMALFSGVVILFALREIWKLTPKEMAKDEIRYQKRKAKYEQEEASRAAARHAKR